MVDNLADVPHGHAALLQFDNDQEADQDAVIIESHNAMWRDPPRNPRRDERSFRPVVELLPADLRQAQHPVAGEDKRLAMQILLSIPTGAFPRPAPFSVILVDLKSTDWTTTTPACPGVQYAGLARASLA